MLKISIIIPVYNTSEDYLRKCLDSVVRQTYPELQVIVIDDGSKNNAGLICDEYSEKYNIFTVQHIENKGVSNARNIGIEQAKGEYLLFLDADDWIDANLCSDLVDGMGGTSPDILVFNYKKAYDDVPIKNQVDLTNHQFKESETVELQLIIFRYSTKYRGINLCTPWCKLYKTSTIVRNGITFIKGLKRAEDMLFNLYALEYAKDVRYIDKSEYYYRVNASSESQTFTSDITDISQQILGYLQEFIQVNRKNDIFKEAYYAYCIANIFEQMYMYYFNNKNQRKQKIKDFLIILNQEPYKTAHRNVNFFRLRHLKMKGYTIITRLHLRKVFLYFYQLRKQ